jgi:fermentation-respiration switch protein FrsA (DUF1100 family)
VKEEVTFYSEGTKLAGDIYLPDAPTEAPRPGIVLVGGYTYVKEVNGPAFGEAVIDAGYAAIAFDFKGWGSSDGPSNRLDPYGRVWDAHAALTVLAQREDVDSDRIGVIGWSYGGATATWLAAIDPRVHCVANMITLGNGRRWMESVRSDEEVVALHARADKDRVNRVQTGNSECDPIPTILHMSAYESAILDAAREKEGVDPGLIPLEFIDETLAFNPEWVVDKIAPRPVLFVATEKDGVCPPEESRILYEKAGEPKKLVMIPDCGHFEFYSGAPFEQAMKETIDWFDTHL